MLKKEDGFTLIEMLIVLTIISLLIILIIPNLGAKSKEVNEKGCEALKEVVQAQVNAYQLDTGRFPSNIGVLEGEYITENQTECKDGRKLTLDGNGVVGISGNDDK